MESSIRLALRQRSLGLLATLVVLAGGALADVILQIHAGSLTSYLAGKTKVQDARPRVEQRGVNLDGSPREASTFPMAISGNPFENAWQGDAVHNGVHLDSGTWAPTEVDVSLPAPGFRWTIGRTFNARAENSGQYDSDGPQGRNWFQTSMPEIVLYQDGGNHANDVLYLIYGADRYVEFNRTSSSAETYKSKNGAAGVFERTSGSPDTWTLTDQHGNQFTFLGFNTTNNTHDGQIWKIADPAGNVAYVGDSSSASTAITNGFDAGGRVIKAYDSADRRFTYTYNGDTPPHLTQVKVETKSGGTWASPTGVTEVAKVDYTYYGDESNGDSGDLKTVTVTLPLSDSGVNEVRKKYYRYWEGTFNASTNPGHPHAIKLVLDYEGVRNFDYTGDSTFDDDFLTETTDNLKPYAAAYFEYDSSHRVDLAWFNGYCGCGGAGAGAHEYRYETNTSYSDSSGYDTAWARRTSVERPDGSWITQYFDEAGQALSHVVTDADPANTNPAPSKWVTNVTRDSSGRVSSVGTPASVSGYTHSSGAITTSTSAGLIWTYTRLSSGDASGFASDKKYKTGSSGSEYFERSWTWNATAATKTIGTIVLVRPLMTGDRVYSQAITSGTTGSYETTYAYTTYSGDSQPLAVKKVTTTDPAVATGNNGSGSAVSTYKQHRKDGLLEYSAKNDGANQIVDSFTYTNGQPNVTTQDADTSGLSDSDLQSTGTELARATTRAYDGQGRPTTTTLPDGRVTKQYYSVLADRRLVVLSFPKYDSGAGKHYGPVQYRVLNHAGKPEVESVIAVDLAGSSAAQTAFIEESDADPITAVDTGSSFGPLAQMQRNVYDEAGTTLEEERAYFSLPSSGAGTDGTHYDPTKYGYDDSGRRRRVKEASGTIHRTVYDLHGRVTARWIGTNDSSFPGGESGTDNMVKVEELAYDSGSDSGNSYLTKRTLFIQDSATGKRETTFTNDVRGNAVLVTAPAAPHTLKKFDNKDRVIAVGLYSSASGLSATSDPTSVTTNRLALGQTFYDELGRVWKSQRHQIDAADGSDDDNLQALTWYDKAKRRVKFDGRQLEKWLHDRLDRQTHHFALASVDDTVYGDADDVTGDIILVERQTTYDTGGEMIMQAQIDRFHTDKSTGQTTGALDTNADGDSLAYTAANVKGRIQITSLWYDYMDRLQDRVEYGTYSGSTFDRDGLTVPARSDTALRTTYTYNTDGTLKEVSDPKDIQTRYTYDALGRQTKVNANYVDGTPGGGTNGDNDQTVEYAYTDGLRTSITAKMPSSSDDQVTTYTYGTIKGASAGDSKIATGHLLQKVTYPDSGGSTDVITFAYNALAEEIYRKDQSGNVVERDYDDLGRETARKVTTLATGYDGAVRRITTGYSNIGRFELVTQYDAASAGNLIDQVKFTHDGWGLITKFEQDRDSAVSGGGNQYTVQYAYEKATTGRNTVKRTSQTLPSGRVINYAYRSVGGLFDLDVSRVTQVKDGTTAIANYDYNGLGQVVGTYLEEPDVMWRMYSATAGDYPDLDIFNRVTKSRWTKDLATDVDFYSVTLTYDRNSNITSADDLVHAGMDVLYTNDDLNRLIRAQEGTLSGGSISSTTRDQTWTLSQTGNWSINKLDLDGDLNYSETDELNETRTHNKVNELSDRDTNSSAPAEYTSLGYDGAGNLTDDKESYKYEYDAFYRLRKVKNQSNALVAEYWYNGLGYRLTVHQDTDTDGDVDASDKKYHSAYDERWRIVSTFRESDSSPKEEFIHHAAGLDGLGRSSYIDLVIMRLKDANTAWTAASDGTLEERIVYCQNWRADVSALVTSGGALKEWVKYSAYGVPYGIPGGDTDTDFAAADADLTQVQTWIDTSTYNVLGDIDLNGAVNATDKTTIQNDYSGTTLGRGVITAGSVSNRKGYAGYELSQSVGQKYQVRFRMFDSDLGRWMSRDPLEYVDGMNLQGYVGNRPHSSRDPYGLACFPGGCPPAAPAPAAETTQPPPTQPPPTNEDPFTYESEDPSGGDPEWDCVGLGKKISGWGTVGGWLCQTPDGEVQRLGIFWHTGWGAP
jgi:RHS repeat-associated protein